MSDSDASKREALRAEIRAFLDSSESTAYRIIEKMAGLGASQRAIAKTMGVSQSTVSRILKMMGNLRKEAGENAKE